MDRENNNMENKNKMHTASDVFEKDLNERFERGNEVLLGSGRMGRKGAAQAAQGLDPDVVDKAGLESPGVCRVVVSHEANRQLDELVAKVNDGFDAGRVTRPQVLSWLLRRFAETASEEEIQELRAAHFDRIAYLEALLKRAKETGVLPAELHAAIQPPCAPAHIGKKAKRGLTRNLINDEITKDDKA